MASQHESREYKVHNPYERKPISWRRRVTEHLAVAFASFLVIRFGGWYENFDATGNPTNASNVIAFVSAMFIGFLFVALRVLYNEHVPLPHEEEFGPDGDDYKI